MAWLRIPPRYVTGLAKLQKLPDEAAHKLAAILSEAPLTFSGDDLLAYAAGRFQEDKAILDFVIPLLLSLTGLRLRLDLEAPALVEVLAQAIDAGDHPELLTPDEDKRVFLQRLTKLLGIESLLFPVKGPEILSAHEYVFAHARIVSDIRPIFGSDVKGKPPAAAVVHTLQLTCHHAASGAKDLYVAMDNDDLSALSEVVRRAFLKAENLKSLLNKMDITVVGEGTNHERK